VPLTVSEARDRQRSDDGYRIPDSLIDFVHDVVPYGAPLYLDFGAPSGNLPGVPWEKLMTARLKRPVLRLGAVPVRPVRSSATLDIAYCSCLPGDGEAQFQVLRQFIRSVPPDLPRKVRLHVFVDTKLYPKVHEQAVAQNVRVYCPTEAAHYARERPTSDSSPEVSELENPWLLWIRDSLKHLSVDGVHFVTMGHLGRTRPAISFPRPPVDGEGDAWSPRVGSRQLAVFLEQVGAWAVCFSSPPENTSLLGLRMLFDEITRTVTGPAALHDMASDPEGDALGRLYRYMFAPETATIPRSPALVLATHPNWTLAIDRQASGRLTHLIDEYSLSRRVLGLTGNMDAPAWVTAQQRSLEKAIGKLAAAPETEIDKIREKGVLDALKFTSDLVAKYANRGGTSGGDDGEETPQ
jgi:hypothetical protein